MPASFCWPRSVSLSQLAGSVEREKAAANRTRQKISGLLLGGGDGAHAERLCGRASTTWSPSGRRNLTVIRDRREGEKQDVSRETSTSVECESSSQ